MTERRPLDVDTCPACGRADANTVFDTRVQQRDQGARRRKRRCVCEHEWATLEVPADAAAYLIKALADEEGHLAAIKGHIAAMEANRAGVFRQAAAPPAPVVAEPA